MIIELYDHSFDPNIIQLSKVTQFSFGNSFRHIYSQHIYQKHETLKKKHYNGFQTEAIRKKFLINNLYIKLVPA